MNDDLFEAWRSSRSNANPPPGFADRVMQAIAETSPLAQRESPAQRWSAGMRTGLVAAAVAVALFRLAELLSIFSATGIENEPSTSSAIAGTSR